MLLPSDKLSSVAFVGPDCIYRAAALGLLGGRSLFAAGKLQLRHNRRIEQLFLLRGFSCARSARATYSRPEPSRAFCRWR